MMKNKNVPKIRFKGFVEEWEETTIQEVCSISTGKSNTCDKIDNGEYPFFVRSSVIERSDKYLFDEEAVLTAGDGVGTGKVFHYINGKYDLHQRVYRMFDFKDVDGKYFYYFFMKNFYARVISMTAKSSVDSVRYDMIADMEITYPENLKEQYAITNWLNTVDNLIHLNQKKLEKLKNFKKASLEKMFTKKGATTPKIRFKGFSSEWEEKRLDSLTSYKNGKGHETKQASEGKYELINLNSVSIDGGLKPSGRFIDETTETLQQNDLVMVLSDVGHGDLLGRVALIPENNRFVLNQRVALLRPTGNASPSFLFYCINANQQYFKKQGAGSSQLNISKESVETFIAGVPSPKEQKMISYFLSDTDRLITKQQIQLTKLQNIKKACLDKMFVTKE